MRAVFWLMWLFLSARLVAQSDLSAEVKRSEALYTESIPHLTISKAPLEEALAVIRRLWEQSHPMDSFPVGINDYEQTPEERKGDNPLVTLELKNVPYIEALRAVGFLTFRRLLEKNGMVQFEQITGLIIEDWSTEIHPLPSAVRDSLRLSNEATPAQVQKAFENFGVRFEQGMMAALADSGKRLIVRNTAPQQQQIAGILLLLKNGFEIQKPTAEPPDADPPATH